MARAGSTDLPDGRGVTTRHMTAAPAIFADRKDALSSGFPYQLTDCLPVEPRLPYVLLKIVA